MHAPFGFRRGRVLLSPPCRPPAHASWSKQRLPCVRRPPVPAVPPCRHAAGRAETAGSPGSCTRHLRVSETQPVAANTKGSSKYILQQKHGLIFILYIVGPRGEVKDSCQYLIVVVPCAPGQLAASAYTKPHQGILRFVLSLPSSTDKFFVTKAMNPGQDNAELSSMTDLSPW
jgi:hypothetical protein